MPDEYDKLNPNIAKNPDGSDKYVESEPEINSDDGKYHIQRDEWREDIIEQGDDKFTEPTQSGETVYVKDDTSQPVQFEEEVVVDIEGETTGDQTESQGTDVNESTTIIADGDGRTKYYTDNTTIIYDKRNGGSHLNTKGIWEKTLKERYKKKYNGVWGGAVTKGISSGIGYSFGQNFSGGIMTAFNNMFGTKTYIDVIFHYKLGRHDVSVFKYKTNEGAVKEVTGLTVPNVGDEGEDRRRVSNKRTQIEIIKELVKKDLDSKGIGLSLSDMTSGDEKGSLYQFYEMLCKREDSEYALYVEIQIYEKTHLFSRKEIGHFDLRKARIEGYILGGASSEKSPIESMQISGYLRELDVKESGIFSSLTGRFKSQNVENGFTELNLKTPEPDED